MNIIVASSILFIVIVIYILYREYLNSYNKVISIDVKGEWKKYDPSLTCVVTEINGFIEYEYVLRFRNLPDNIGVKVLDFYVFIEPYKENQLASYKFDYMYFWVSNDYCFRIIYSTNKVNKPSGLVYISGKDCVITNASNEKNKLIEDFVKTDGGGLKMRIQPNGL